MGKTQVFDEQFEHWPLDCKIKGRVIVAGDLEDLAVLKALVGKPDRQQKIAIVLASPSEALESSFKQLFAESAEVEFPEFPKTRKEIESLLRENEAVAFHSSEPLDQNVIREMLKAKEAFNDFLGKGKLIVALGGAAEIVAHSYFQGDDLRPSASPGLNLLRDCILETNFDGAGDQKRLLSVLATKKHGVGVGLDKETALVLSGRKIWIAGKGKATFVLKGNEQLPPRVRSIRPSNRRSRDPESVLLDLTQWRRDAIDRTLPTFPARDPRKPLVRNGTLMIVGGGGSPRGMMATFIEFAGGVENAKLVYVPCSEKEDVGERHWVVEGWKKAGIRNATFIHTKDRNQANSDVDFLVPLKDATGLYFGGGRQWNFSDSYYGTEAHRLMKEVLKRGGVIAGSSAGASIQGRYLARATPIGNSKISAFGYERGGLGFLDGVAIDQHFAQRNRFADMTGLVTQYPQLLGIGIDEATAIIVQKSKARVIGRGQVHFYDRNQPVSPGEPDHLSLPAGSEYDLASRKILKDRR